MESITVKSGRGLAGTTSVPGDKSITHRAVIIGALARGTTRVKGYLASDDCLRTVGALREMGIAIEADRAELRIEGKGLRGLSEPRSILDLGNSGTAIRLLTGLLAGQDFFAVLTGDESVLQRPMLRVVEPLRRMGARIEGRSGGDRAPIAIRGGRLKGITYALPVASAQVKSALLIAGLTAEGKTVLSEPLASRNHTERIFGEFGIPLQIGGGRIVLEPTPEFGGRGIEVPGDLSSAAFFIVAATIVKNSEIVIQNVGVNPTRTGILELLTQMGARIVQEKPRTVGGEAVADLVVKSASLKGISVGADAVPRTIDEFPILCVAAALAEGETIIRGAGELRVKESDRIRMIARELSRMGAKVEELSDGLVVRGVERLKGARCSSGGDHRIAMALAVAGLAATGETVVEGAQWVETSFPDFQVRLSALAR